MNPRCYSCGLPVGHFEAAYHKQIEAGASVDAVLTDLGIDTLCCRIQFITYAKSLTETLAIMANQEPATFEGGPLKICKENRNNRNVKTG